MAISSIFENDRTTNGFDIFFWEFNDSSSYNPTHWHTAIEITYVINGKIDLTVASKDITLLPGDLYLIDSKVPHSSKSITGNHAVQIQLPYSFLKRYIPNIDELSLCFDCHTSDPNVISNIDNLKMIISEMYTFYDKCDTGGKLKFNSLLFKMLFVLVVDFSKKISTSQSRRESKIFNRLDTVLKYSNKNYMNAITLSEIASVACFEESYFCHFFKKNVGLTYIQYLNKIRFSHIVKDLKETDIPLNHLLEIHGFTNYKLFREMFNSEFNTTPGQYRKTYNTSSVK